MGFFFVSNIIWKIQKEILNLSIFFLFPVFFFLLEVPSVLLLVVVILFLQEWITPLIMMASYFMLFYLKIFFPTPHALWDLCSLTRYWTWQWECGVFTTVLPGNSPSFIISFLCRELSLAICADCKFYVFYLRMPSFPLPSRRFFLLDIEFVVDSSFL